MKPLNDGLPKYVVNWNELTEPLKKELLDLIIDGLKDKYPQISTDGIEELLEDIRNLLPASHYADLKRKIDDFVYKKIEGIQKVDGAYLDIPPIIKETQHDFKYDKDVFLTGFHVDQNGWKKEDRYHLVINKNYVIKNAATKEIGEHKYFNTYFKVNANTPISFILENNSGNSRETMIDLEYIEGNETTITPPPPLPNPPPSSIEEYWIKQIPNAWDIAVVMNWEAGGVDVDLHGFIGTTHVYYPSSTRSIGGMVLNWDYTEHNTNLNPEIISVSGNHGKTMKVFIHNYSGVALQSTVSVKIYKKDVNGNPILLKEYKYTLSADRHHLYGVCSIVINTLTISDLNETKIVI